MGWDRETLIQVMEEGIPFNQMLGMKCTHLDEGTVTLRLPFREAFIGDVRRPALHGGVISTMIDVAGGAAAFTVVDEDQTVSTVDLRVDYLRPGPKADIEAIGTVIRKGNRVCLTEIVVRQAGLEDAPTIAKGTAVYNIVDRRW